MNLFRTYPGLAGIPVAVLAGLMLSRESLAADATPAPTAPAAPYALPLEPPCEHCSAGVVSPGCEKGCRTPLLGGGLGHGHVKQQPFLCPGACFGYFQTKWSRWEDVCSLYYQGLNVSDAPRPPAPEPRRPPKVDSLKDGPMPSPMPPAASPLPSPTPIPAPSPAPSIPLPLPMPESKFSP